MPAYRTVLFVGNSFTRGQGGLDLQVQALAASARPAHNIQVQRLTQAGATLARLRQNCDVQQAIRSGGHDLVVLQDDLPEYGGPPVDTFKSAVRALNTTIIASGGRTLLFMAWAYERMPWISQADIATAHRSIATELGISVAPVGLAFDASRAERPMLPMLGDDWEHESLHGTYLAACVMHAALFQESPEGASHAPVGVTVEEAAFLQRIAWRSVTDWDAATPR